MNLLGEDGHLTALRPSRLELIAASNPENLDVLLAPIDGNRQWGGNWKSNCAQIIAAVDPVVQVLGP
jgi:hypothetical protein